MGNAEQKEDDKSLAPSRFVVHKEGDKVNFFGNLTDTTTFDPLKDVLTDGAICDFSKLNFASWIGLNSLCHFLSTSEISIKIIHAPLAVFASFKLLDHEGRIEFLSAELGYLQEEKEEFLVECFDFKTLNAKFDDQGEFSKVENKLIFAPQRFSIPANFYTDMPIMFSSGWMKEDCEEATFWLSYVSFTQATLDINITLLSATEANLFELLTGILHGVEGGEETLKLIDPKISYTLVKRLAENISVIKSHCEQIFREMNEYSSKMKLLSTKIMKECHNPTEKAVFLGLIREYFEALDGISIIANKLEEYAPQIGEQITQFRAVQILKSGISKVTKMEPEMLEEVRDAYSIMDFMSEDSWPDTKVEVLKEIDKLENKVGKCIVTLQGYDLLRQILEHRFLESVIVKENIPKVLSSEVTWTDVKSKLFEKIGAQLVTDQEKMAYKFYLPEGYKQYGDVDRKEPGDMLLF